MDSDTRTVIQTGETDSSGAFVITLPFGKRYSLNVNKSGYVFFNKNFNLTKEASMDKPYILDIELKPLKSSASNSENSSGITLHDLNFALSQSVPSPESFDELEQLFQLMTTNPSLKIAIHGHTDNVGSAESNVILSQKRADAVKKFLTDKGIAAERITCKGFGERKPIDSNDTEEGRARNRRTEFIVESY
jgi:outer membrane protein OmpA-like peptidoglycan-associated protein